MGSLATCKCFTFNNGYIFVNVSVEEIGGHSEKIFCQQLHESSQNLARTDRWEGREDLLVHLHKAMKALSGGAKKRSKRLLTSKLMHGESVPLHKKEMSNI